MLFYRGYASSDPKLIDLLRSVNDKKTYDEIYDMLITQGHYRIEDSYVMAYLVEIGYDMYNVDISVYDNVMNIPMYEKKIKYYGRLRVVMDFDQDFATALSMKKWELALYIYKNHDVTPRATSISSLCHISIDDDVDEEYFIKLLKLKLPYDTSYIYNILNLMNEKILDVFIKEYILHKDTISHESVIYDDDMIKDLMNEVVTTQPIFIIRVFVKNGMWDEKLDPELFLNVLDERHLKYGLPDDIIRYIKCKVDNNIMTTTRMTWPYDMEIIIDEEN